MSKDNGIESIKKPEIGDHFWHCLLRFARHYAIVCFCLVSFLALVGVCLAFFAGFAWLLDRVEAVKRMLAFCAPYASSAPWVLIALSVFLVVSAPNSWNRIIRFVLSIRKFSKDGFERNLDNVVIDSPTFGDDDIDMLVEKIVLLLKRDMSFSPAPATSHGSNKESGKRENNENKLLELAASDVVAFAKIRERELVDYVLRRHAEETGARLVKRNVRFRNGTYPFDGVFKKDEGYVFAVVRTLEDLNLPKSVFRSIVSRYRDGFLAEYHLDPAKTRLHILIAVPPDYHVDASGVQMLSSIERNNSDVSCITVVVPPERFR